MNPVRQVTMGCSNCWRITCCKRLSDAAARNMNDSQPYSANQRFLSWIRPSCLTSTKTGFSDNQLHKALQLLSLNICRKEENKLSSATMNRVLYEVYPFVRNHSPPNKIKSPPRDIVPVRCTPLSMLTDFVYKILFGFPKSYSAIKLFEPYSFVRLMNQREFDLTLNLMLLIQSNKCIWLSVNVWLTCERNPAVHFNNKANVKITLVNVLLL